MMSTEKRGGRSYEENISYGWHAIFWKKSGRIID